MSSMLRSTGIIALSTLASRILGFVREMLFAAFFGATGSTDAFFVAFRIPNLLRRLVAEGALTVSFIPVYSDYLINRGEEEALQLARRTLTLLMIVIAILVLAGEVFSPWIVRLFAIGFTSSTDITLAVELNRILFPYLVFVGFVAFSMGVLNSHNRFFAPAFSPVLLNIGIITGIAFFSHFFEKPLYGVALGVLAGGVLQVFMQIPYLVKTGFRMKVVFDIKHPGIRRIFRLMAPAVFGIAVYQVNILMSTILASMLPEGSISFLYYTDRLTEMVLGVFIVSIGNVILPHMSRITAQKDMAALGRMYRSAMRAALFLAVPAAIALFAIGLPVISVIFLRGAFTPVDAIQTNSALSFACFGIIPVALLRITTPTFYSLGDTKTPVRAAAVAFVVNITLGYILMNTPLLHAGLALANVISVTIQGGILLVVLRNRMGKIFNREFFLALAKVTGVSILMGAAVWKGAEQLNWLEAGIGPRIGTLSLLVLGGLVVYGSGTLLLRVEEARELFHRIVKR
jgi:putative peptidoglycan lipid II flippase